MSKAVNITSHLLHGPWAGKHEGCWKSRFPNVWLAVLQLCTTLTLLSRGWLMFRWDSHIRGLCWNEELLTPWIEQYTDSSWDDYALHSDPYITSSIEWLGITLMIISGLCLLLRVPKLAWLKWSLVPAFLIMTLDAFGNLADKDYDAAMAMEYALQVGTPLALLMALTRHKWNRTWGWIVSLLAASCFLGHGLYAAGHFPLPWSFQTMSMTILRVDEEQAKAFLYLAGVLDFIVAAAILIPALRRPALYYMILWGGVTSLARVLAHYNPALKYNGLDPWVAEMLVRSSHWLLPLLILALLPSYTKQSNRRDDSRDE
ncbi:hypothetical protein HW115_10255 [Verrucomicrobiaceae bacterium N1E253]|uniref:Uncharacterized protein n=1 Tax=Oceaniferula marina TaxID=2748318 RepID=A0A851GEZ9_9BACT|nr:hypothetical protein [Oceaniferula marina]NWK55996.1 hypothetical protein [Oceaniferula marina]